jgi:hypothetical protein
MVRLADNSAAARKAHPRVPLPYSDEQKLISEFNNSFEIGLDGICDYFDFDAPLNPPGPTIGHLGDGDGPDRAESLEGDPDHGVKTQFVSPHVDAKSLHGHGTLSRNDSDLYAIQM